MTETNSGHTNTGDWNTGDWNTGDRNTGDWNTGDWNTGDGNTGDRNTGFWNTGDWNTGDCNTGFFNTTTPDTVTVFNTHDVNRNAFLNACPDWFWRVTPVTVHEGVTAARWMHEAWAEAWDGVDDKTAAERQVRALPGFDYDVWVEITGITFEPSLPATVVIDGHTYRLVAEASDE